MNKSTVKDLISMYSNAGNDVSETAKVPTQSQEILQNGKTYYMMKDGQYIQQQMYTKQKQVDQNATQDETNTLKVSKDQGAKFEMNERQLEIQRQLKLTQEQDRQQKEQSQRVEIGGSQIFESSKAVDGSNITPRSLKKAKFGSPSSNKKISSLSNTLGSVVQMYQNGENDHPEPERNFLNHQNTEGHFELYKQENEKALWGPDSVDQLRNEKIVQIAQQEPIKISPSWKKVRKTVTLGGISSHPAISGLKSVVNMYQNGQNDHTPREVTSTQNDQELYQYVESQTQQVAEEPEVDMSKYLVTDASDSKVIVQENTQTVQYSDILRDSKEDLYDQLRASEKKLEQSRQFVQEEPKQQTVTLKRESVQFYDSPALVDSSVLPEQFQYNEIKSNSTIKEKKNSPPKEVVEKSRKNTMRNPYTQVKQNSKVESIIEKMQVETIINQIKFKHGDNVSKMSQQELQAEVMKEITMRQEIKKPIEEVDESKDTSVQEQEETEIMHDRRQQIQTSKAFEKSRGSHNVYSKSVLGSRNDDSQMEKMFQQSLSSRKNRKQYSPVKTYANSVSMNTSPRRTRTKSSYSRVTATKSNYSRVTETKISTVKKRNRSFLGYENSTLNTQPDQVQTYSKIQTINYNYTSPKKIPKKKKTESKSIIGYSQSNPYGIDESSAFARQLYVESTVNDVKRGGQVKPGQMNLIRTARKASAKEQRVSQERIEIETRQITGIYGGETRPMKNPYIQRKTAVLQDEFEQQVRELVKVRSGASEFVKYVDVDTIMDGYYKPGTQRKHVSPTKRLIQHKDSTWQHKQKIQDTLVKGSYSQTYCISPGKSYVIEPQGGELDYDIAEASPVKFFNQVLHQDIKKASVRGEGRGRLNWILTQRPLQKIMDNIKGRLVYRLQQELGSQYAGDINNALVSGGNIDDDLMRMVENKQIDLVDQDQNLVLENQISQLTNTAAASGETVNLVIDSPDARKLDQAELKIQEQRYNELKGNVVQFVKQNSLVKEAQNL